MRKNSTFKLMAVCLLLFGASFNTVFAYTVLDPDKCPAGSTAVENPARMTGDDMIRTWECSPNPNATPETVKEQKAADDWSPSDVFTAGIENSIGKVLAIIGIAVMEFMAVVLSTAGLFFNSAIKFSIVGMRAFIEGGVSPGTLGLVKTSGVMDAINTGWSLFRDLINMSLIFILLYASVKTIIGSGGFDTKKTISNVIIVALFINFSLFATKFVIDISNVLAVGMYENIVKSVAVAGTKEKPDREKLEVDANETVTVESFGLSGAIIQPIRLAAVFNSKTEIGSSGLGSILFGYGSNIMDNPSRVLTVSIVGSIMMLVTAFVFFAGGFLFIIRLVALIMVMVTSPLAFGSLAFPNLGKKYFNQWLGYLVNYSFFAPIFLFLIYFVAYFLNNADFVNAAGDFGLIINFTAAIVMMLATLVLSNNFGIAGGKMAQQWAGKLSFGAAGWVGRQTVGRGGLAVANSAWAQKMAVSDNVFTKTAGRSLVFSGDKAARATFDARNASPIKGLGSAMKVDFGKVTSKGIEDDSKKSLEAKVKFSKRYGVDKEAESAADEILKTAKEELDTNKKNIEQLEKNLEEAQETIAAADAGAMIPDYAELKKKADDLEAKKAEAEQRKRELEKKVVDASEAKKNANRRRQYANSIENDFIPTLRDEFGLGKGTKGDIAKEIRKELDKGKKDKLMEDILKQAAELNKEEGDGEKKGEGEGEKDKGGDEKSK